MDIRKIWKIIINSTLSCCLFSILSGEDIETSSEHRELRVATSTSTVDSGLMGFLKEKFEEEYPYRITVYSVGSGTAIRMGRAGKVDLLITHSPGAEARFMNEGFGSQASPLMSNDFVIIGPKGDPAGIYSAMNPAEAFEKIFSSASLFVSRADDSGTNRKELEIWEKAKLNPVGNNWYVELGSSMGKALSYSNEMKAYTIIDRGTWMANRNETDLELLFEGDALLNNPYTIITVHPGKHPGVEKTGSEAFLRWATSEKGQALISSYHASGVRLFAPASKGQ